MDFRTYLEKHGPNIQELEEMDSTRRTVRAINAFESFIYENKGSCRRRDAFRAGFELAAEIMAYQHMAQDARAADQAKEIAQIELDADKQRAAEKDMVNP